MPQPSSGNPKVSLKKLENNENCPVHATSALFQGCQKPWGLSTKEKQLMDRDSTAGIAEVWVGGVGRAWGHPLVEGALTVHR